MGSVTHFLGVGLCVLRDTQATTLKNATLGQISGITIPCKDTRRGMKTPALNAKGKHYALPEQLRRRSNLLYKFLLSHQKTVKEQDQNIKL